MNKWVKADIFMILMDCSASIFVLWMKWGGENVWTGLYPLLIMPLLILDLKKDLKK